MYITIYFKFYILTVVVDDSTSSDSEQEELSENIADLLEKHNMKPCSVLMKKIDCPSNVDLRDPEMRR